MRNPEQIFDRLENDLKNDNWLQIPAERVPGEFCNQMIQVQLETGNEFEIEKFEFLRNILKSIDPSQS